MADIIKGILGEVSGLVGTVVGAVVRGKATIKSRPRKSSKPPKQSQINQRSKFKLVTDFVLNVSKIVNVGFKSFNDKMSPINAAVQYNLENAVTGVYPNYKLNYPTISISKKSYNGTPESLSMVMAPPVAGKRLIFNWDSVGEFANPAQAEEHELDRGSFLLYNATKHKFLIYVNVVDRKEETLSLLVPFIFTGDEIHVYFFFTAPDGFSSPSESRYLGKASTLD